MSASLLEPRQTNVNLELRGQQVKAMTQARKGPRGLRAMAVVGLAGLLAAGAQAATLPDIFAVAERLNQQAKESQAKVDALTEETNDLYSEYKNVLKVIEGLRVYNRQLQRQINAQEQEMAEISGNMDKITEVQRQITPLMDRMVTSLEQFVENDLPFRVDERRERVDRLRQILDRADVAVSEQFSQVLNAFQIENDYGRTIDAYSGKIQVDGHERVADILLIGRVALVYQTSDGEETGHWNKSAGRWEVLDDKYQASVRNGIRMARKQATLNLLPMPVALED